MMKKKSKLLITGGAGFIGSEFVRQQVAQGQRIIVVDKLSYAGNLERLKEIEGCYDFYKIDIAHASKLEQIIKKTEPDIIIHFAAETHVDRSITDVKPFIKTNIIGTQNLIDYTRKYKIKKFLHISTDEVYGDSQRGLFKETSPLKPNNPYSATKAAAEHLIKASIRTFRLPAIILRPSNNYGPWQYPEKFIPIIISKALKNQQIPVYGQGKQIREWLHVSDCGRAIEVILKKGMMGETYNIGSAFEQNNLATATMILQTLNKPLSLIHFIPDRLGHDFRYSVDCKKLKNLGWRVQVNFKTGIKQTSQWYQEHLHNEKVL